MRLKYYKLTIRQMGLKKPFVFFLLVILISFVTSLIFEFKVIPYIKVICESNSKRLALVCTNQAVEKNLRDINYDNLVTFEKDSNGKITAMSANTMVINLLSNRLSTDIQNNLSNNNDKDIKVPVGLILGSNLFSGVGPNINIKTIPEGHVNVEFKSRFENSGINQVKNLIYLEISTLITNVAPFYSGTQEYKTQIVIAETVIISDVPASYYNINGLKDFTITDTLDLIED